MILVDTDVCIGLLFGSSQLIDLCGETTEEIAIISNCVQELYIAASESSRPVENKIAVEKFLLTIRLLYPDHAVMQFVSDMRAAFKRKGKKCSITDLTLYAFSRIYGHKLITTHAKRYCFT